MDARATGVSRIECLAFAGSVAYSERQRASIWHLRHHHTYGPTRLSDGRSDVTSDAMARKADIQSELGMAGHGTTRMVATAEERPFPPISLTVSRASLVVGREWRHRHHQSVGDDVARRPVHGSLLERSGSTTEKADGRRRGAVSCLGPKNSRVRCVHEKTFWSKARIAGRLRQVFLTEGGNDVNGRSGHVLSSSERREDVVCVEHPLVARIDCHKAFFMELT